MLSSIVKRYMRDPVKYVLKRVSFGSKTYLVYQNSGEILDKLRARDFNATSFSTLYTTLPHNLIKD